MQTCSKCGNIIKKSFNVSYNKSKSSESSHNVSGSLDSKEKTTTTQKTSKGVVKKRRDSLQLYEDLQIEISTSQDKFIKRLDLTHLEQQALNDLLLKRWKTTNTTPLSIYSFLPRLSDKGKYIINNDKVLLLESLNYPYKIKEKLSLTKDQFITDALDISPDLFNIISKKIRYLSCNDFYLLFIKELIICELKSDSLIQSNKKAQSYLYTIYIDWYQSGNIIK